MIRLCLAVFTAFILLAPHPAPAQEQTDISAETPATPAPIGTIAEIEGNVAFAHNGEQGLAQVGQEIYLNDTIETGPESKALLLFIDDTEFTLGENASTTIDEYVFDAETPENNKGRFSVARGAFIFVTGLIDKNDNPDVRIETSYGSIGIRGTTVWGGTLEDAYNVFVADGAVTFANERGRVRIGAGQGTSIHSKNAIPDRARPWEEGKIARATRTVALKNVEQARERVARMKEKHAEMRERHLDTIHNRNRERRELQQEQRQQHRDQRMENRREHRPEHSGNDQPTLAEKKRAASRKEFMAKQHPESEAESEAESPSPEEKPQDRPDMSPAQQQELQEKNSQMMRQHKTPEPDRAENRPQDKPARTKQRRLND